MNLPEKFKEYIWLVNTISRHPEGMTLEEINREWVMTGMSGGQPLARTTFQRHKNAIEEMFGLFIECDAHRQYRYYIGNEYVLHENSVQNWLLSTLTVGNLLTESLGLQQRILLEHVATDSRLLEPLIQGMRSSRLVWLHYHPYQADSMHHYAVAPYCLKLFRMRWYLLGRRRDGELRVYALDRIRRVELTAERFEMDPYFDAEDYFSECYGVVAGDGTQAVRIRLRARGREQYALRDLPLHHTQRLVVEGDGYTDFELVVRPTADLKAQLLSRGRWLQVLQPAALAAEIRQLHQEAADMYGTHEPGSTTG